jgi:beta-lactamase regulating signal transducer with metallopeptidase domain
MIETLSRFDAAAEQWTEAMTRACWLGGAAILIAWAITRFVPRLPANARMWLWRLAYLKLLFALIWTAPIELPLLPAVTRLDKQPAARAAPVESSATSTDTTKNGDGGPSPGPGPSDQLSDHAAPSIATWFFVAWLTGVAACFLAIARNWLAMRRLCRLARPTTDPWLTGLVTVLCRRMHASSEPRVLICDAPIIPQLVGVAQPTILLPAQLLTRDGAEADLRMILAHELAHWRRRDLWWNWLPALAHGLFFFHPAVWLANRHWRLAQEIACDEAAIRLARVRTAEYGRTLLNVVEQCRAAASPSFFSVGVSHSFQTLSQRIVAMKSSSILPKPLRRAITFALVVGAVVGLVPWRLTAQETKPPALAKIQLVPETSVPSATAAAANESGDSPAAPTPSEKSAQGNPSTEQFAGRLIVNGTIRRTDGDAQSEPMHNIVVSIDPNTGHWKPITTGGHSARISPDGTTLAFEKSSPLLPNGLVDGAAATREELWTCDARTGADARRLAEVGGRPIWSPDGRELVSSDGKHIDRDDNETPEKPVWEVATWKLSRDGGEKTELPIPSTDFVEDWSPDGEWFVTSSDRHAPYGSGYQIYLMRTDGTAQRRLTDGRGLNVYVRFSPDGKQIVFLHQEKSKNSIRTIDVATGDETVVFEDDGLTKVTFACWSPDGKRLAIMRQQWYLNDKGEQRLSGDSANPTLAILDLVTKDLRELKLQNAEVKWLGHADWR